MNTHTVNALCIFFILLISPAGIVAEDQPSGLEKKTFESVEERRVYLALRMEHEQLKKERDLLEERKMELKRLEVEVDKKLEELGKTREDIRKLLAEKDEKEMARILELSKIYEKMVPENAARLLMALDQKIAVGILEKMKVKAASAVLNKMDRKEAARLSTAFSQLDP
ncbi:MAG: hypothetical protein OEV64_01370 [Desulfobulbaceae bacterium]|nr:hypothetical protein [Desulfobulbaceae bacterium]